MKREGLSNTILLKMESTISAMFVGFSRTVLLAWWGLF